MRTLLALSLAVCLGCSGFPPSSNSSSEDDVVEYIKDAVRQVVPIGRDLRLLAENARNFYTLVDLTEWGQANGISANWVKLKKAAPPQIQATSERLLILYIADAAGDLGR